MSADVDVLVIGAGQAGLAVSHELDAAGVEHVVLEADRIGRSWAQRWGSFCLVTPNHTIRLPGGECRGPDAGGFLGFPVHDGGRSIAGRRCCWALGGCRGGRPGDRGSP